GARRINATGDSAKTTGNRNQTICHLHRVWLDNICRIPDQQVSERIYCCQSDSRLPCDLTEITHRINDTRRRRQSDNGAISLRIPGKQSAESVEGGKVLPCSIRGY